nr:immunoglobulin heavy chain junction region [Macaca mulatta]MOY25311.1 immunoglobulin heavy chain junction region [Macaca mulatta]MOY25356.1 immunoglobulin heavy chain junction region [Macaca mulatta]MOY26195.1 immunoglobulin heavy chain junction region [Macaca mulatta]MOY26319.1 immunoglobulin heavy chain junction region [Macaca mulatta]
CARRDLHWGGLFDYW